MIKIMMNFVENYSCNRELSGSGNFSNSYELNAIQSESAISEKKLLNYHVLDRNLIEK